MNVVKTDELSTLGMILRLWGFWLAPVPTVHYSDYAERRFLSCTIELCQNMQNLTNDPLAEGWSLKPPCHTAGHK